ncbi:MAG: ribulose-phosphate 3-epimerase [Methanomassiliicoccales archaeon]|jgi:ribulose-phosphate 3-epimerase|nr:ribulose-phosphate 3-epimerase [Methanomassiliicoccales archaeon]
MIKIAPSILSANFSRLGEELKRAEDAGADWIHIDVMDGHFVPNITIGPVVIKSIRPSCSLPFDVHLMVASPERFIDEFARAGADLITIHIESTESIEKTLRQIKSLGKKAGLSLNPATPFETAKKYMELVDLVLVMTVQPGFAGQKFMPEVIPKLKEIRQFIDHSGLDIEVEVDGGINRQTCNVAVNAGATVLAAGSALFSAKDMKEEIRIWKELVTR